MITTELISHIKEELAKGKPKEQIRAELMVHGGWDENDIEEGFNLIDSSPASSVPVKTEIKKFLEKSEKNKVSYDNKKSSENWRIAGIYFLLTRVVEAVVGLSLAFIILFLIGKDSYTEIFNFIIASIGIWMGVMFSAKYINKKYIILSRHKIITLAIIYLVSIQALLLPISVMRSKATIEPMEPLSTLDILRIVFMILLFCVLSYVYVRDTEKQ